jgi:threonyl-tRNA synthetase
MQKIPFMIIVGEQEEKDNTISVRRHGGEDIGVIGIEKFSKLVASEIDKILKKF